MKKLSIIFCVAYLLTSCGFLSAQENSLDGAILVLNKAEASVHVFFTDPSKEAITIPTGAGPSEIVLSPDRKLAVVSNYGHRVSGRSLTLIDLENFTLLRNVEFGGNLRPNGIAFLPDGKHLLVTFESRRSVGIFDIESGSIIKEILTNQARPLQIAIHPTAKAAYVTNERSGTISVIDLNDLTLAGNIPVGVGIEGIDVSPNGKEIWIANKLDSRIHVIETVNHRLTHSFESPVFPTRLKFTADSKNVIVLNAKSGHLTIVDVKTKQNVSYLASDDLSEIVNAKFSLTEMRSDSIAIQRRDTILDERVGMQELGEIAAPVAIEISPNYDFAFITNQNKNSVSVMNLTGAQKFRLAASYALENAPGEMVFLPVELNVTEYKTENGIERYWGANRPSEVFFNEMLDISDEEFAVNIEVPFLFVLSRDELKVYEALSDMAAKKDYIKEYINKKNENPLFPVNYWFLEYSGRVQYAKENYGLKKAPYIDDRGKFYIKYGKPLKKHVDLGGPKRQEYLTSQKNFSDPTQQARNLQTIHDRLEFKLERTNLPNGFYNTVPNETWAYVVDDHNHFTVYFAEQDYFRELKNGLSGMLEARNRNDVSWYWMDLVKDRFYLSFDLSRTMDMIARWEMEYSGLIDFNDIDVKRDNISVFLDGKINELTASEDVKKVNANLSLDARLDENNIIDFQLDFAQFKNQNKETRIKLVTYADPNKIEVLSENNPNPTLNLEMEYLFRDSSMTELNNGKAANTFESFEEVKSVFLASETSLLPIKGDMTVQVKNTDTDEAGFLQNSFNIRDFTGTDLILSDILFYTQSENVKFKNNYVAEAIKGINVIPYPYPFIDNEIPLMCYFEVYNLFKGNVGSSYNIELKLTKDKSGKSIFSRIGRLFGGGSEVRSMKYQINEYENDSIELIGFDLSKVGKGNYNLEIIVTALYDETVTAAANKKLVIK